MIATHEESWQGVKRFADAEIEKARDALERPTLGPAETEFIRGKIAALRSVLALENQGDTGPLTTPVDYMKI